MIVSTAIFEAILVFDQQNPWQVQWRTGTKDTALVNRPQAQNIAPRQEEVYIAPVIHLYLTGEFYFDRT